MGFLPSYPSRNDFIRQMWTTTEIQWTDPKITVNGEDSKPVSIISIEETNTMLDEVLKK